MPNPFRDAYRAGLAAKAAALLPPAPPAPENPFNLFLSVAFHIRGLHLLPSKNQYFVALSHGYFATLRQCGGRMKNTRHILALYKVPPQAITVQNTLDTKSIAELMTTPFVFHSKYEAQRAIHTALSTLAD